MVIFHGVHLGCMRVEIKKEGTTVSRHSAVFWTYGLAQRRAKFSRGLQGTAPLANALFRSTTGVRIVLLLGTKHLGEGFERR